MWREYIYTLDGAEALVTLAATSKAYGQNGNIPGCGVISRHEVIEIAREVTGNRKKAMQVGRGMLAAVALFNPMMRSPSSIDRCGLGAGTTS